MECFAAELGEGSARDLNVIRFPARTKLVHQFLFANDEFDRNEIKQTYINFLALKNQVVPARSLSRSTLMHGHDCDET